jgi:hypothetical protein
MKQQIVAVIAEKLCLHRCMILLNISNNCLKNYCFFFKVRSYNSVFLFMSMSASFIENIRIEEQLANPRLGVYMFRVQGTICLRVDILLPVESRTPSFAHLYVFASDAEGQVNMRCCVMDGLDKEIVATVQHVLSQVTSFVEMSLQAGEFIRSQELLNVQFATHEVLGSQFGNTCSPNV